jgi:hypothetical protein
MTHSPSVGGGRAAALDELRRGEQRTRRRRRLLLAGSIVTAVVLIAALLIVIGLNRDPREPAQTSAAAADVIKDVTGIPTDTFDRVGAGTATNHPNRITAPPLTRDGKPRVLYVGAEFCPFCAAQRWAMVAALARFGTFTDLAQTESASDDVYPGTATLSFHGSSYSSDYLSFTGVETSSNQRQGDRYAPLDALTPEDQKLVETYNAPPYVDEQQRGSIPFTDLGGAFLSYGASFDPQLLAGRGHAQIAAALNNPDSDIAKAVVGTANVYTAAICELTDDQPAGVCTSKGVQAAAKSLGRP